MKANSVKAPIEPMPSQPCCMCQKTLYAPWGRVDHGNKVVCGSVCQKRYDEEKRNENAHNCPL